VLTFSFTHSLILLSSSRFLRSLVRFLRLSLPSMRRRREMEPEPRDGLPRNRGTATAVLCYCYHHNTTIHPQSFSFLQYNSATLLFSFSLSFFCASGFTRTHSFTIAPPNQSQQLLIIMLCFCFRCCRIKAISRMVN